MAPRTRSGASSSSSKGDPGVTSLRVRKKSSKKNSERSNASKEKSTESKEEPMPPTTADPTSPLFFYQTNGYYGPFSQWYHSPFTASRSHFAYLFPSTPGKLEDVKALGEFFTFSHAEQYMMFAKALLFTDFSTASLILDASNPGKQKQLGRQVQNFDEGVWVGMRERIVLEGNVLKFGHDSEDAEEIRAVLLGTGERELVEAAPRDRVWGIGFGKEKAPGSDRGKWGLNLLGKALVGARERLRKEASGSV